MSLKKFLTSKPILILEIAILGYFAFNVGQEMFKRHDIEAEISRLENEINKLEKDKGDLNSLLSYVQTDVFVEQEAREKLNLAKAGESLVLLPRADTATGAEATPDQGLPGGPQETAPVIKYKSNLVKWWQYFFEHERLALE